MYNLLIGFFRTLVLQQSGLDVRMAQPLLFICIDSLSQSGYSLHSGDLPQLMDYPRLIPLARGIYGISLIVSWITRSKITNLFITYLAILFVIIYFSSIVFFFMEHPVNPPVKTYWDAFNWAMMNVTTVGSNIFGVTKIGQSLAVLLAASGMIFFPIFTAYVTTKFQNKRKGTENN